MKLISPVLWMACLSAVCLTFTGCGDGRPSLVQAEGTVTLNGEPLADAKIGFLPVGDGEYQRSSRAKSDASGKFVVSTYGENDGLPVGKYQVTVEKTEVLGDLPDGYNTEDPTANRVQVKVKRTVPIRYSDPYESGLTVEVTSDGLQPSTINVTSDGGPEVQNLGGRSSNEP